MATTTDHTTIQTWAAKHNGVPGVIEKATTANDQRPLAIIWPEDRNKPELREVSWETFFEHFELRQLALDYTALPQMSKEYDFVTRGSSRQ